MGSIKGTDPDRGINEVQHTVTLTRGFWMADHEVTQGEYQAVMGSNPSYFQGYPNRPVENLSWDEAVSYCQKVTNLERAAGRITAQQEYRLPSEAEWEYAARAGTTGARYTAYEYDVAKSLDYIAWHKGNSDYKGLFNGPATHPVMGKFPNPWGLYDMMGNVSEWCADWYGDYPTGSVIDPTGPASGSGRVFRGGSAFDVATLVRSARRDPSPAPGYRSFGLGFRPALSPVR